jgi:HMG-box domain
LSVVLVEMAAIQLAPNKKVCKNHDKFTYTGKEMSPLGLGFSAEGEEVGTVKEGRNGDMWRVAMKKTPPCDIRVWVRVPTHLEKDAPVIPKKAAEKVVKEIEPAEEEKPAEPAPAPKKKAAAPAKKVVEAEAKSEAPKKAMSGFNAFVKVRIAEIKAADPKAKDAFKQAIDEWKTKSDAEKKAAGTKALADLA